MSATPTATAPAVSVVDLTLPVPDREPPVRAWLVAGDDGAAGRSRAGVLWLHWLGHRQGDRGEFLPLAVELASRGVVSLLPAGHFPWVPDPDGTARDVTRVLEQVDACGAALDHLLGRPGVDAGRVAVVGHDYGGMYAALLADRDERVSTLALQAVDAGWANWFATYWLELDDAARTDYAERFSAIEPVAAVERSAERLGDGLLLQWAGNDTFVGAEVPAAYATANPQARTIDYPKADHMLGDRALHDLTAFLAERLGLDQN